MKNIILCNNLKGPVDYIKLHKYLSFKKVYWIFYSFLMLSNNYHYNFLIFPLGWSFFAQFLILFLDTSLTWLWYMLSYNVKKTYLEIMVLSNVFILMSNLIFKRTNSIPGHKWVFLIFSHTFQQLLFVWVLIWRWNNFVLISIWENLKSIDAPTLWLLIIKVEKIILNRHLTLCHI